MMIRCSLLVSLNPNEHMAGPVFEQCVVDHLLRLESFSCVHFLLYIGNFPWSVAPRNCDCEPGRKYRSQAPMRNLLPGHEDALSDNC